MKYIIYISSLILLLGCSDYLDQVPEEKLNEETLFKSKDDAVKVLTQAYSYFKSPIDFTEYPGLAADEADLNWTSYGPHYKDQGEYSPGAPIYNNWADLYKSIRSCIYFLDRIDECDDDKITPQEITWWKGEAYFLQGYYYFLLLQQYGPVPLIKKVYNPDDLDEIMKDGVSRSHADTVVNYIDKMLVEASNRLDTTYSIADRVGRVNASAAWFLRSRLWLYAASPLYNGLKSGDKDMSYLMCKNSEGNALLNYTFDKSKWKKARDYALQAINVANSGGYKLLKDSRKESGYDNYKRIFSYPRGGEPNSETIFYKQNYGTGYFTRHALPISWSAYSGICPTWAHVNEYFMSNGLMPEDDEAYKNGSGFFTYSKDGFNIKLYHKFLNRDPRFYCNILFPERYSYAVLEDNNESFDKKWAGESNNELLYFRPYHTGKDGFKNKTGRDYTKTGFLCIKWVGSEVTKSNYGDNSVPIFRYTELLLNYVESAIEYDISVGKNPLNNNEIFEFWDKIRERVGVPGVKEAYSEAGIELTPQKLRKLIHRERRVELAFEGHRYFDNRRWLDAEREGGAQYGLNIMKDDGEGFWTEKHLFENRYWNDKMYFMPILQSEIDKNKKLTQNALW